MGVPHAQAMVQSARDACASSGTSLGASPPAPHRAPPQHPASAIARRGPVSSPVDALGAPAASAPAASAPETSGGPSASSHTSKDGGELGAAGGGRRHGGANARRWRGTVADRC